MSSPAYSQGPEFFERRNPGGRAAQAAAVRRLADLLDTRFRLPFGLRIGWDGLLGFLPGIGDLATNAVSFYILIQAALLGCPPAVLARMAWNLVVDNLLDAIPLLGNFFDFFWRANTRNVALMEAYFSDPHRTVTRSRWAVFFGLTLVLLLALVTVGFAVFVTYTTLRWLGRQGW